MIRNDFETFEGTFNIICCFISMPAISAEDPGRTKIVNAYDKISCNNMMVCEYCHEIIETEAMN
jgi:hypothetical protein